MNTTQAPTALELRAYALGQTTEETSRRVLRYLLLSGDEPALRLVSAFSQARLRVEQWEREKSAREWPSRLLAQLGDSWKQWLEGVQKGVLEVTRSEALATLSENAPPIRSVRFQVQDEPQYLYVFGADLEGNWRLLHAPDQRRGEKCLSTPTVPVPEEICFVLGVGIPTPLATLEVGAVPSERLKGVLGAASEQVQVSWQPVS